MGDVVLALGMSSQVDPEVAARVAVRAERCGYQSLWLNHESSTSLDLRALAAAARAAERIELGVGVVPISIPVSELVGGVNSLGIAPARLTLGIGAGERGSVRSLRRAVTNLRQSAAERVVVGALGPRMLRMAGEEADGVLLNWVSPSYASHSREIVVAAAVAAGRPVPRILVYVRIAVGDDADVRARRAAAAYTSLPAYARHFARQGVDPGSLVIRAAGVRRVAVKLKAWEGIVDEIILRPVDRADLLALEPIIRDVA